MLRFILLSILLTIIVRAVSRLWSGVVRGMQGGVDQSYEAPRPRGARMPQHGVQSAAVVIAALPTLLVYLFGGKYFLRGLTAGAVK